MGDVNYRYDGEVAIVTGSTKGIGRGIARQFAEAGANVVVNARSESDVRDTAATLAEETDGSAIGVPADMSEPAEIEALVEEAIEEFGGIDHLVNNAAAWPPRPMPDVGLDAWDHGFDVNARGTFYASTLVARHMRETGREGTIVNVTSQAGERHGADHGLYGVSKAAQNGLTWRMAHDLAEHGIRVNAVSTAITDTYQLRKLYVDDKEPEELTDEEISEGKRAMGDRVPLGRIGEPDDIANGVLYLASDAASYVTGHVLRVSGGMNLE